MIDRPWDQIRDLVRENNKRNRELLKFVFEKSDNISLWIVGLAIGGVSFIANNVAHIKQSINPEYYHTILFLLVISVACGITYRILYLYLFVILNHLTDGIEIAMSREKVMDKESMLTGNETFAELLVIVENTSGEDLSHMISRHKDADDREKKIFYDSMVNHYLKVIEFAQKDTALAIDFIAETYSKFTGKSKERYLTKFNDENPGRKFKWTLGITTFFYFSYLLSFILALFLFAYSA